MENEQDERLASTWSGGGMWVSVWEASKELQLRLVRSQDLKAEFE